MLAEVLWICPKCRALVMSVDRKRHRRWHKKHKPPRLPTNWVPLPIPPGNPGATQHWSVLPKKSWDVWEKKENPDE
jgi:hypothetical protein